VTSRLDRPGWSVRSALELNANQNRPPLPRRDVDVATDPQSGLDFNESGRVQALRVSESIDAYGEFATRVTQVIARQNEKVVESQIVPQAALKSLGFDSFGLVSLMFELEEEFNIKISDDMLSGIRTVGDVIDGVHRLCRPG
jgi:acyl carrier protein